MCWSWTPRRCPTGKQRVLTIPGPRGDPLLAMERDLLVGRGADAVALRLVLASERAELMRARHNFSRDLMPYVTGPGALLLAAFWAQIVSACGPCRASRPASTIWRRADGPGSGVICPPR